MRAPSNVEGFGLFMSIELCVPFSVHLSKDAQETHYFWSVAGAPLFWTPPCSGNCFPVILSPWLLWRQPCCIRLLCVSTTGDGSRGFSDVIPWGIGLENEKLVSLLVAETEDLQSEELLEAMLGHVAEAQTRRDGAAPEGECHVTGVREGDLFLSCPCTPGPGSRPSPAASQPWIP